MIKTTILGGSTPIAGELIRILINHPDIDLRQVQSDSDCGVAVADVHTGLVGETDLRISPRADLAGCDALFVCDNRQVPPADADTRIIAFFPPGTAEEYVYGLPELNRKPLVRGATRAVIPSAQAMLASLALLPMARNLLLAGDIDVSIGIPAVITDYDVAEELERSLRTLQTNMGAKLHVTTHRIPSERVMTATCTLTTAVDLGELLREYHEFYDDHNFTFIIPRAPRAADVEGTNKCLIYLDKQGDTLKVQAAYDAVVKGNAGTAVHCMNLLMGLHERTGLALKASRLGANDLDITHAPDSQTKQQSTSF